jgi:septal ring factor EnvC (AmiA/AmiB activator)
MITRGVAVTAGLALIGVLTAAPRAQQETDRARTEALARRAADRLQTLQQEADRLASDERSLLGDLRKLELDREIKTEQLHQIVLKASSTAGELTAVNEQVRRIEQEELKARPELRGRIVELYKLGGARYVRLLLSTANLRDVAQASRTVAALAKRDQDRVAAEQQRLAALQISRKTLEARTKELAALRADAERTRSEADRAIDARNALIHNIDQQRDLNAELSSELVAAQQKLQLTLRDLAGGSDAASVRPATLPLAPFRGDLAWPVAGTVRERFGRASATGRPASNGIEIAADEGSAVRAVHDGTVAFADTFAGFGRLVILEHGPQSFSLYGNLTDITVSRGARVESGQDIGSVGSSATGAPGLYFELRIDGHPVDPLQWLRKK